ncbi:MAG: heme ABC exporter ATP-binding protein CcmA [Candidatus Rariloculaceae bacterium]
MSEFSTAGLNVSALEIWRGENRLFSNLSFELEGGEIAIITGGNGTGKTTLLRILAGLSLPAKGIVTWRGKDVRIFTPEARIAIVYQGHLEGLKKDLTVVENLEFYRSLWMTNSPVAALLEELGLAALADSQVRYLSAGQRRRVALGCMRLRQAQLWLLDEPFTNLDAAGTKIVAGWLASHAESGGTAVVATHLADNLSGKVAVEVEL